MQWNVQYFLDGRIYIESLFSQLVYVLLSSKHLGKNKASGSVVPLNKVNGTT